jgi:ABC-type uncharacterized transport system involved in gliding motility auxiliary subunit
MVPFNSGGFFQFVVPYPFWPKVTKKGFNQENPITSKLESLSLPWPAPLNIVDTGYDVSVLATTSNQGWSTTNVNIDPNREFNVKDKDLSKVVLAMISQGEFESYFKGQEIPVSKENENSDIEDNIERETKDKREGVGNIIVVGDSDFVSDSLVNNFQHNLVFLMNAVDYLTLDEDLIAIRSKTITDRPLKEISDNQKLLVKTLAIVLVPLLFIIYGLFRMYRRKKKQNNFSV